MKLRRGIGRTGQHDRVFSGSEKFSANSVENEIQYKSINKMITRLSESLLHIEGDVT